MTGDEQPPVGEHVPNGGTAQESKGAGWRAVRRELEREFSGNFQPLREAIQRNELFGSVAELFLSAVVGVTKLSFGVKKELPAPAPPPEGEPDL